MLSVLLYCISLLVGLSVWSADSASREYLHDLFVQIASDGLKGRVFEVSLADLQGVGLLSHLSSFPYCSHHLQPLLGAY